MLEAQQKNIDEGSVNRRKLNSEEIEKLIPHREPVLFLDEIEIISENKAIGYYTIKGNEFGFKEAIPIDKILLEFLNQCCGVLISQRITEKENKIGVLVGYDNIQFLEKLSEITNFIGAKFKAEVKLEKERSNLYIFSGNIKLIEGNKEEIVVTIGSVTFSVVEKGNKIKSSINPIVLLI